MTPVPELRRALLAPHQLDAVRRIRSMLRRYRGAVLADEPGLGKTRVAATIAAIRMSEGDAVEVVSPAALVGYWKEVLAMFGVEAAVSSHELLARERMQRGVRLGRRLVIVDEAHRFRNPRTKRYEGLARLSIGARVLLVTATPVCNSPFDLASLLALIAADDELVGAGVESLSASLSGEAGGLAILTDNLIVRRGASDVGSVTPVVLATDLAYEPAPDVESIRRQLRRLTFPWMSRRVSRDLALAFLHRRLESSVAALAATLLRMARLCRRAGALAARGACLTAGELRAVLGDPDGEAYQDVLFPTLWGASEEGPSEEELAMEGARLDAALKCLPEDPKIGILESIVTERAGTPGLVFTVSFDTALSLFEELSGSRRCGLLTGIRCQVGAARRDIAAVVAALNDGAIDLVISTDVGGVGLNLESAGYVVHYDQPWSPAVLEQRIGRIRRIGQRRSRVESIELIATKSRTREVVEQKQERLSSLWRRSRDTADRVVTCNWNPPPVLKSGHCQSRLARRLRAMGLASGELAAELARRQRAGVERWIEQLEQRPIGLREVEQLLKVLRAERTMILPDDRAI